MSLALIEELINGDEVGHDTLGVWDWYGDEVFNVQHCRYTNFPVNDKRTFTKYVISKYLH